MGRRKSKKNSTLTWMHQRQSVRLWPFSLSSENSRRRRPDHSSHCRSPAVTVVLLGSIGVRSYTRYTYVTCPKIVSSGYCDDAFKCMG
ncbi:hypothetical protein H671_4g12630 [Cricetulus griseus]|uniref:Uncharacterized protein n=1 Tax=Cricetulus griseus TaxID=10029 RepID=A0A061I2K4_CRIGR|nr:hypothetical protein H671_4g12630 [Cricetulus griseus]